MVVETADQQRGDGGGGGGSGAVSLAVASDNLGSKYSAAAKDKNLSPKEREAAMLFAVAEGHLNEEEDREAFRVASEAVALFREVGDDNGVADAVRIMVNVLCYQEKRKEANQLARDELLRVRGGADKRPEAKMLISIAEVNCERRGQKNREEALVSATEAQVLFRELGDKKMEASAMLTMLNIYMKRRGDKRKAAEQGLLLGNEARTLYRAVGDRKGEAMALHGIAVSHIKALMAGHQLGADFNSWHRPAKEALEIFRELRLKKLEAYELVCMAQWQLGSNPRKALKEAKAALAYCQEVGSGQEAAALGVVVQAHLAIRDANKDHMLQEASQAAQVARQGLARFRAAGDAFGEGHALNALVLAYMAMDETAEALRCAEEGAALFRRLGDKVSEATMLQLAAQLHLKREQPEEAYKAAQEISFVSDRLHEKAVSLEMVFEVHMQKRDFKKAMETAEDLRLMCEEAGDSRNEAVARLLLCNVHFMKRSFAEAVSVAREAQALLHDLGAAREEANALRVIAEVYAADKQLDAALRAAERARRMVHEIGDYQEEAATLFLSAQVRLLQLSQGKVSSNTAAFTAAHSEALRTAEDAVSLAKRIGDLSLAASALCTLAQVQMTGMNCDESLKATEEAMAIFRDNEDQKNIASVMCIQADIHLVNGNENKALVTANKALNLYRDLGDTRGEYIAMGIIEHITGPPEEPPPLESQEEQWSAEEWAQWEQQQQQPQAVQKQQPQPQQQQVAVPKKKRPPMQMGDKLDMAKLTEESVQRRLTEIVKMSIEYEDDEEIEMDKPLMQLGVTSKSAVTLRNALAEEVPGLTLPFTLIFDYPSINAVTDYILEESGMR